MLFVLSSRGGMADLPKESDCIYGFTIAQIQIPCQEERLSDLLLDTLRDKGSFTRRAPSDDIFPSFTNSSV